MRTHFIFDLVSSEAVDRVRSLQLKAELRETLATLFDAQLRLRLLDSHPAEKHAALRGVFLDFLVPFAAALRDSLDSNEKLSVALQVAFTLFCTTFARHLDRHRSADLMQELLGRHAGMDPPKRFLVFELRDVKAVSEHFVDHFFVRFEDYARLFATQLQAEYKWGHVSVGRFPLTLELDFGVQVATPAELPTLRDLYFSERLEDELDDVELAELMKGRPG